MASQSKSGGGFLDNLGKIYLLYTGGFFVFVVVLGILEKLGVPNYIIGYGFVFLTIAVYAVIGILSRTAEAGEYYVAGRSVPALYNGMATGADWMSAASFVGMAGSLFLLGYDGLAFVLGWTGGFVLVAILIAPFLRKFGAYTVPDFFAARYEGNFPRFLAVMVLIACSFTYVVAQIFGTGLIAQRFLGMDFTVAVYVGLIGILLCSMLGGMKAVTWTQVAQYIVLIVAYLVPVIILSTQKYGLPIPQLTYGQALADIAALEKKMVADGLAVTLNTATGAGIKPHTQPFLNYTPGNFFALILCLMVGTASLPHVLMRYFTTPSVREARKSVAWSLFFIFLLYFTAPAYAAFSKLEVYNLIAKGTAFKDMPEWIATYTRLNLVTIHGTSLQMINEVIAALKSGGTDAASVFAKMRGVSAETAASFNGLAAPAKAVIIENAGKLFTASDADKWLAFKNTIAPGIAQAVGNTTGKLTHAALGINADAIVLSTPEIAGMPYVIAGLVAAGGLAAALSTADGLLLAIANALSHDVYYKMIDKNAPTSRRLVVSRVLLVIVAVAAAATAATKPADILAMVAWAFSLAAAGIFPALVLGVWWKRANKAGCIAGMILGFGLCLFYLVVTRYFPGYGVAYFGMSPLLNPISGKPVIADIGAAMKAANAFETWVATSHPLASRVGWMNINNISSALFSLPLGFLTIIVVSLMTKAPSQAMMDMIDQVRRPKGETIMQEKSDAVVAH